MARRLLEIFAAWLLAACYAFLGFCAYILVANIIIGGPL